MTETNSIDTDWINFCNGNYKNNKCEINKKELQPECSDLYISTKTKISYLSCNIDLKNYFWNLPIISYHDKKEGIIKKQMKFNSQTQEELDIIISNIDKYKKKNIFIDEYVITKIDNPNGRIKFKDIRKVSIGINKKDIISYRCKKKSAFYNCFVVIIRIKINNIFKEFHVKIFNTGKLEIPGIQDNDYLNKILNILTTLLNNLNLDKKIITYKEKSETVLINSNFTCGFLINRDKLHDLLKNKYKINCSYDPCSYPGIQCNFFYDKLLKKQTGIQPLNNITKKNENIFKMSFMIFRTGSILIVGKCDEYIINEIYFFIKNILKEEYKNIVISNLSENNLKKNKKVNSCKKKKIYITTNYYNKIINRNISI
tara:strand:+ start:3200 stop:4312 length:1113 start_codon:yes stop_codon:yes gene_type:complete